MSANEPKARKRGPRCYSSAGLPSCGALLEATSDLRACARAGGFAGPSCLLAKNTSRPNGLATRENPHSSPPNPSSARHRGAGNPRTLYPSLRGVAGHWPRDRGSGKPRPHSHPLRAEAGAAPASSEPVQATSTAVTAPSSLRRMARARCARAMTLSSCSSCVCKDPASSSRRAAAACAMLRRMAPASLDQVPVASQTMGWNLTPCSLHRRAVSRWDSFVRE